MSRNAPVLVFIRSPDGGISEYTRAQAMELLRRGYKVSILTPPAFAAAHPSPGCDVIEQVLAPASKQIGGIKSRLLFALATVINPFILAFHILRLRPRFVVLESVSELLAPLWFAPHWIFAHVFSLLYVATLHDPVRIRSFGPAWWHRLSVWAGHSFVRVGLIHHCDDAMRQAIPRNVALTEVPMGLFGEPSPPRPGLRQELGIPGDAQVALSFGYVTDRKNLGLVIAAMPDFPSLHLLVAGRQGSTKDKGPDHYRQMASTLGVADRCYFVDRFIADDEVGRFFQASDFLLLTYQRHFVSQSAVLHVAANWDLPVLASCGDGPMITAVRRFDLGLVIDPDSQQALNDGIHAMLAKDYSFSGWERFRDHASWKNNVALMLEAIERASPGLTALS